MLLAYTLPSRRLEDLSGGIGSAASPNVASE
jgi:hypothetical protein